MHSFLPRILFFLVGFWAASLWGEANPYAAQMGVFNALGKDESSLLSYRIVYAGYAPVTSGFTTMNFWDQAASGMAPLYHSPTDLVFARASGDIFNTGGLVILPLTGFIVPSSLYTAQVSFGYTTRLGDREAFGIMGGLGTATNAPFVSFNEAVWTATIFYTIPSGAVNQWAFLLAGTNNRPGLSFLPQWVPFPGIEFIWRIDPAVTATIGIPFLSFHATFSDFRFAVSGSFSFAHLKFLYQAIEAFQPYVAFDWDQRSYLLNPRAFYDDRFIFSEMKVAGGFQFPIYRPIRGDLNGGYGFNRSFRMQSNGQTVDQANISGSWEISARVSLNFDDSRKVRQPTGEENTNCFSKNAF
jgi:hypothetical protein